MKIKTWICVLNWNDGKLGDDYYKFNSTKWNVSTEELCLCIEEQIYGDLFKNIGEKEDE